MGFYVNLFGHSAPRFGHSKL